MTREAEASRSVLDALMAQQRELSELIGVGARLVHGRLMPVAEADRLFELVATDPLAAIRFLHRHEEILSVEGMTNG